MYDGCRALLDDIRMHPELADNWALMVAQALAGGEFLETIDDALQGMARAGLPLTPESRRFVERYVAFLTTLDDDYHQQDIDRLGGWLERIPLPAHA